jgi:Flp pilus assembly protein TadD
LRVAVDLAQQFPTIDDAQANACSVHSAHGLHKEAIDYGWKAHALSPRTPSLHTPLAYAMAAAGHYDEARNLLQAIENSGFPEPSADTAAVYLALGERERAIAKLVDACERGVPQFSWTRSDPRLASLKGDPTVEQLWSSAWRDQHSLEPSFD